MTVAIPSATSVEYGHLEPVIVFFDDLDMLGFMHNARYPVLLERALTTYWARHGFSYVDGQPNQPDLIHAVRSLSVSYLAPIRGTGQVGVHFWFDYFGRSSAQYGFRFLSEDGNVVYAEGTRTIVRLDPETLRPARWTDAIRQVATGLLRLADN
jgi:acyl-CoA thioester hydrolase